MRYNSTLFTFVLLLFISYLQAQEIPNNKQPFNARSFPYADIHCHSAFKPFNSQGVTKYNIWEQIDHDCDGKMSKLFVDGAKEVPKTTQCHLEGMMKGNVRLGFVSLTPLEKGMQNVRFMNEKKKGTNTMACVSGIELEEMIKKNQVVNYYNDLVENIKFLRDGQNVPYFIDGRSCTYEMVKSREQLTELLQNPNKIALLFTVEGGHALGLSLEGDDISKSPAYEQFLLNNVDRMKGLKPLEEGGKEYLDFPLLSINLNHFFWNGLGGHSRTFSNVQNLVFGQNKGADDGITELGKKVVERLLDAQNGRRILLDIKHMSLESRRWYYDKVNRLGLVGDNIPIISSHSTVAGLSWNDKEYNKKDNNAKLKNSYLYNWQISLADEDIVQIYNTKGLIGIMLDKYKLMGDLAKKEIDKTVVGSTQRKNLYMQVLFANILACVKAVNKKEAWDIVCLGSDFDGMIVPFENYPRANEMPDMVKDMYDFLQNPTDIFNLHTAAEVKTLMFGLTAEEIIYKFMYKNAYDFALRNLPSQLAK
jgi:microsomal dipeptidase-like Zn-dependent dipeptidase